MNLLEIARGIRHHVTHSESGLAIQLAMKAKDRFPDNIKIILQSSQWEKLNRESRQNLTNIRDTPQLNIIHENLVNLANELESYAKSTIKIFICCGHSETDQKLASRIHQKLSDDQFQPFWANKDLSPGENRNLRIISEITSCDFFIILHSQDANLSEMVLEEVKLAKDCKSKSHNAKPYFVPIHIQYPEPLPSQSELREQIGADIQACNWQGQADTSSVLEQIIPVLSGEVDIQCKKQAIVHEQSTEVLQDTVFPFPTAYVGKDTGAMTVDSPLYVIRPGEKHFIDLIEQEGVVMRIKGPRQFGKTSLLARVIQKAKNHGQGVIHLNLQHLETATLGDLDKFLKRFCIEMARDLNVFDRQTRQAFEELWADKLYESNLKCTIFIQDYILARLQQPILITLDEADRIFPFREVSADFFGMLRAWHDQSILEPAWRKLSMVLVYSTEIHLAIKNLNQSPFNIGSQRILPPFRHKDIQILCQKHQIALSINEINKLNALLGGHPFLIRRALAMLAHKEVEIQSFHELAPQENGPFSDHLRRIDWMLTNRPECQKALYQILRNQVCHDNISIDRLRAAGLLTGSNSDLQPASELYRTFFMRKRYSA